MIRVMKERTFFLKIQCQRIKRTALKIMRTRITCKKISKMNWKNNLQQTLI